MSFGRKYMRRFLLNVPIIVLAACASVNGNALSRDNIQAMLNSELKTGDGADSIQAFFTRHEFPYTYDPSLRRYASIIERRGGRPISIYIYTDNEQNLTVAQVIAPEPQPVRRSVPRTDPALELNQDNRRGIP